MLKKNIMFLLIGIYLITALLGYQIGWSVFQYDELRLLQFPLALFALLILIFTKKIEYSISTQITFFLIGLLIAIQITTYSIFSVSRTLVCDSITILYFLLCHMI